MYATIMQEEGGAPDFLRSRSLAAPSGMKMRDDSFHRGTLEGVEGCYLSALLIEVWNHDNTRGKEHLAATHASA